MVAAKIVSTFIWEKTRNSNEGELTRRWAADIEQHPDPCDENLLAAANKWLALRRWEGEMHAIQAARLQEYRNHHHSEATPSRCRERNRSPKVSSKFSWCGTATRDREAPLPPTPEKLSATAPSAYLRDEINVISNQVDGGVAPSLDLGEFDEHCSRLGINPGTVGQGIGSTYCIWS